MADTLMATDDQGMPVDEPESAVEAPQDPTPVEVPEVDTEAPADAEEDAPAPSVSADMEGGPEEVPVHPLTAIKADAKSRSLRSLAQGAVVAMLAQVVLVVYPLAQQLQLGKPMHVDWQAEAMVVGSAALSALVAYLHRALGIGEGK